MNEANWEAQKAEIKRRLSMRDLLRYYGREVNAQGWTRCLLPERHHHEDQRVSLREERNRLYCWSQKCFWAEDIFSVIGKVEHLPDFADQVRRASEIAGRTPHNSQPARSTPVNGTKEPSKVVANYDYTDEAGTRLFQVVRFEPKDFLQRRPDGKGGWLWNVKDTRLVLYRLPDVLKAECVLIVEGEKDVESAYRLGLPDGWAATCNPMGSGKWREEYSEFLRGKRVVILPDADEPGRKHGVQVAQLLEGKAAEILTLTLPDDRKDLSEWAALESEEGRLKDLLESAQMWAASQSNEVEMRNGVVLVCADSIEPQPVKWAWEGRIPLGTLTVIAGDPGLGKSTLTIDLAGRWSRGKVEGAWAGAPVAVAIASAEDSRSATLVPRLMAAGADLSHVHFVTMNRDGVSDGVSFPDDVEELSRQIQRVDANVLIVDPLMAHLPLAVNANRDQHIRRALAPLSRMAEQLGVLVIVVVHLNKDEQKAVLARVGGSMGIVAAARSVLLVTPDPGDPDSGLRMLGHAKCNVGVHAPTLRFRIVPESVGDASELKTSRIQWEGEASGLVAADLLVRSDREETGDRIEAGEWLRDFLGGGPRPTQEIYREGAKAGFSERTLKRAKKDIGVESAKTGFGKESNWCWMLPEQGQPSSKEGQVPKSGPLKERPSKNRPVDAGLLKEGQGSCVGPLNGNTGPLSLAYTVGTSVQFDGGLGFSEVGTIEALEEWATYPGQVCYRMVGGRIIPQRRITGIAESQP